MDLILHGVALSPFVRKVRVFLNEKQLQYQMKTAIPYATREEYSLINPLLKVPALQINDLTLCDSAIICHYLDAKFAEPNLISTDIAQRAHCEWLEKFADYELAQQTTFAIFYQRLIAPTLGKSTDQETIQIALSSKLPALLNYLEEQLGEQQWFIDNKFSLVDISIATHLMNMEYAEEEVDGTLWPNLAQHLNRFKQRKSVACLLAEEERILKTLKQTN